MPESARGPLCHHCQDHKAHTMERLRHDNRVNRFLLRASSTVPHNLYTEPCYRYPCNTTLRPLTNLSPSHNPGWTSVFLPFMLLRSKFSSQRSLINLFKPISDVFMSWKRWHISPDNLTLCAFFDYVNIIKYVNFLIIPNCSLLPQPCLCYQISRIQFFHAKTML